MGDEGHVEAHDIGAGVAPGVGLANGLGRAGRSRGPDPLGGWLGLNGDGSIKALILGSDLGEQDGSVVADRRRGARGSRHPGRDGIGSGDGGDNRVDRSAGAGPGMARVMGHLGHLEEGGVEGELGALDGRLASVEVEVESHIRCQTVRRRNNRVSGTAHWPVRGT